MINEKRLIDSFIGYAKIDSESRNEGNIKELLYKELSELGLDVKYTTDKNDNGEELINLIIFLPSSNELEPIMFTAHLDTVKPGTGVEPYIEGGYIRSKTPTILGGDDKAGIAIIMEALRVIKENNLEHRPIEILFTVCEEIGLLGAKSINYSNIKSKKAIVLDSSGKAGKIINAGAAINNLNIQVIGKSAHAGINPEKGINAILVASEAISNMNLGRVDNITTANIGTLVCEGPTNIVPSKVEIISEIRSLSDKRLDEQTKHMIKCAENSAKKYNASIKYNVINKNLSFKLDEDDEFLKSVKEKCDKLDICTYIQSSCAAYDANVFNTKGIKSLVLGIGNENAHSLEERLELSEFVKTCKIVLELMTA